MRIGDPHKKTRKEGHRTAAISLFFSDVLLNLQILEEVSKISSDVFALRNYNLESVKFSVSMGKILL